MSETAVIEPQNEEEVEAQEDDTTFDEIAAADQFAQEIDADSRRAAKDDTDTIREQREVVSRCAVAHYRLNDAAKSMKKRLDNETETLSEMIARHRAERDRPMPLFDQPPDEEDDSWRDEPITGLGLAMFVEQRLEEAAITTIGALADYTAQKPLSTIKGLGPANIKRVEDAVEAYWAQRKRVSENRVHHEDREMQPVCLTKRIKEQAA